MTHASNLVQAVSSSLATSRAWGTGVPAATTTQPGGGWTGGACVDPVTFMHPPCFEEHSAVNHPHVCSSLLEMDERGRGGGDGGGKRLPGRQPRWGGQGGWARQHGVSGKRRNDAGTADLKRGLRGLTKGEQKAMQKKGLRRGCERRHKGLPMMEKPAGYEKRLTPQF